MWYEFVRFTTGKSGEYFTRQESWHIERSQEGRRCALCNCCNNKDRASTSHMPTAFQLIRCANYSIFLSPSCFSTIIWKLSIRI
jgi:hypothetical protein